MAQGRSLGARRVAAWVHVGLQPSGCGQPRQGVVAAEAGCGCSRGRVWLQPRQGRVAAERVWSHRGLGWREGAERGAEQQRDLSGARGLARGR
eukprot:scaffold58370_cov56-Phaeocystis_antarctica.AAC.1